MLYEIAFTHGNIVEGFSLFTATPRQLVPKSSSVSDIHSSVLVVEETGDSLDLLSFVQQASKSEVEVSIAASQVHNYCAFHPLSRILLEGISKLPGS